MDLLTTSLEKKDGTKEYLNICKDIVNNNKSIIIFGAGVGGKQLFEFLCEEHLENHIAAFSDNNSLKFNTFYCGKKVLNPENLFESYKESVIIVASSAFPQIRKQLISYGYDDKKIFLFNFAFSNFKYTDKEFIYDNIELFQKAYALMEDEKSRKIFVNILNYRITKSEKYLSDMSEYVDNENRQYFDKDLIDFKGDEVFVDAGAYTGDTMETYFQICNNKCSSYICFEADVSTYKYLCDNINKNHYKKVETHNIGLWNEKTNMHFDSANFGSGMISEQEGYSIGLDTLDNVLNGARVDFIKMDIEGSEYEALCGAEQTIRKYRPICAFSVYHKRDDFFKLILLIHTFSEQYKFYFRQYRYTPTETVCYAIPLKED